MESLFLKYNKQIEFVKIILTKSVPVENKPKLICSFTNLLTLKVTLRSAQPFGKHGVLRGNPGHVPILR